MGVAVHPTMCPSGQTAGQGEGDRCSLYLPLEATLSRYVDSCFRFGRRICAGHHCDRLKHASMGAVLV